MFTRRSARRPVTTAVLVMGFAVLSFSSFNVNGDMGLLTAVTIAIALVIDFLLLPPLLLLFDRGREVPENARTAMAPAQ